MGKPLVVDFFCGLGGWTKGFLAQGYDAVGFDNERHVYGDKRYPGQLVLQDVLTLHGCQFRDAAVLVASPPCQEFSYMAMPWSRAKQIAGALRGDEVPFPCEYTGSRTIAELTALFDACFRIQAESSEAAGRYIPLVVENVKGAQPWVGRANANFGSFYLWGDVANVGGRVVRSDVAPKFGEYVRAAARGTKCPGNDTFKVDGVPVGKMTDLRYKRTADGVKIGGSGDEYWRKPLEAKRREATAIKNGTKCGGAWFGSGNDSSLMRQHSSHSSARKAAAALIAEIPFDLANYIAKAFKPDAIHLSEVADSSRV